MSKPSSNTLTRWRLVLGHFASDKLCTQLSGRDQRMEAALDFLYGREYQGRGIRDRTQAGTLDPSQLSIPSWLGEVRELFPKETVEIIEKHALDRYGLTEILTDAQTLEKLEPSMDLLKALLSFRSHLHGPALDAARRIIRQVVEEIRRKLEAEVRRALSGRLNRFRHSPQKVAQNFDWRGTLKRNLKHFDRKERRMILQDPRFFARNTRHLPWDVLLCVDQSGSMTDSVIHSAVMAGILAALPVLRVKLVVFDTSVVDLSDQLEDPVEVLMSVQLGGGTDIGQAIRYCEGLIENPRRSVFILISDFCEGGPPSVMLGAVRRLRESGVTLLGLAALDQVAQPVYDEAMAQRLAEIGMEIAALTPKHLAEWLAKVVSK